VVLQGGVDNGRSQGKDNPLSRGRGSGSRADYGLECYLPGQHTSLSTMYNVESRPRKELCINLPVVQTFVSPVRQSGPGPWIALLSILIVIIVRVRVTLASMTTLVPVRLDSR
jgi:hypothetical protein